ncbi:MAG: hypothetical protein EXX96DRAFT_589754 [Benjaminiella poitrasii]|nr:MAG: hypothetical protein EXX96DRAFT_589754 [Benjaminiella poitrasii]
MMDSFPSINLIIFNKLAKRKATNYILDYVTKEFESIISCYQPPLPYSTTETIENKNSQHHHSSYKKNKHQYSFNLDRRSSLPSPPTSSFSSPLRKKSYNNSKTTHTSMPPTPPSPTTYSHHNNKVAPMSLRKYIQAVTDKSRLDTGTLLTSICYARRLKTKLFHTSKGMGCTHHRIFLATLIIASKYIHDSAIKNKYWIEYALHLFSGAEINLMEKQLLQLLDYRLEISQIEFEAIASDVADVYLQQPTEEDEDHSMSTSPFDYWYQSSHNNTSSKKHRDSAYVSSASSSTTSSSSSSLLYSPSSNHKPDTYKNSLSFIA